MARHDPNADLAIFNEKVERLVSLSFFTKSKGSGAIAQFVRGSGWESVFVGPDEESIEALVLTLRLFMQNNDRISLQNMRTIYASVPDLSALSGECVAACDRLNRLLDLDSNLSIEEGRQLSYREILEIFIYGTYAHVNEGKRLVVEGIRTTPFFPLFQSCLVVAVVAIRQCLEILREINNRALAELQRVASTNAPS